jgi:hypothetical protein
MPRVMMKQHIIMKRAGFSNGIRLKSENLYKALIQDGLRISSRRRRLHICSLNSMRCGLPISNNMQQQQHQQKHSFPRSGILSHNILRSPQMNNNNNNNNNSNIQTRSIASWLSPDIIQDFTLSGGTGVVINSLHSDVGMPYWATFSAMNFMLRASLLPVVIYGARTAARYAKVAPEVQFIVVSNTSTNKSSYRHIECSENQNESACVF